MKKSICVGLALLWSCLFFCEAQVVAKQGYADAIAEEICYSNDRMSTEMITQTYPASDVTETKKQ